MVPINAEDNQEETLTERVASYSDQVTTGLNLVSEIKDIVVNTEGYELDVARQILTSISKALGPEGHILSAFVSLLGLFKEATPSDMDVMLQQFQQTHSRLDAIEENLREIKNLIGEIPQKVKLHGHISDIEILVHNFRRFQRSPISEMDAFRRKCEYIPPDVTLDYIYNQRHEITNSSARHYDRLAVLQAMQALGITQVHALQMYEACEAVTTYNKTVGDQKTYLAGKRLNVEEFEERIETVSQLFYEAEDNIVRNFFVDYAKAEIDNFVAGSSGLGRDDLRKQLYRMLTQKYYWRKFVVGTYSGDTAGFDQHVIAASKEYSHYKYRDNGRSWFVFMSQIDQDDVVEFQEGVLKCINDRIPLRHKYNVARYYYPTMNCNVVRANYNYDSSPHAINLRNCIAEYGFVALLCVKHGNGLVWARDSSTPEIASGNFHDPTGGTAVSIVVVH